MFRRLAYGLAIWAGYCIGHRVAWYKWENNGGRKP